MNRRLPSVVMGVALSRYPSEAVSWLVGTPVQRILDIDCGNGQLTGDLRALGHDVITIDKSLDRITSLGPSARRLVATAEDIPLTSLSVDVVTAQTYLLMDRRRVEPEIARILRPGGALALIWNAPDMKIPWVKKLAALAGTPDRPHDADPFVGSELFTLVEHRTLRHWQQVNRGSLLEFTQAQPGVVAMGSTERERVLSSAAGLVRQLWPRTGGNAVAVDHVLLPRPGHGPRVSRHPPQHRRIDGRGPFASSSEPSNIARNAAYAKPRNATMTQQRPR